MPVISRWNRKVIHSMPSSLSDLADRLLECIEVLAPCMTTQVQTIGRPDPCRKATRRIAERDLPSAASRIQKSIC